MKPRAFARFPCRRIRDARKSLIVLCPSAGIGGADQRETWLVLLNTPRFEILRALARFVWLLNGWTSHDVGFVAVEQRSESLAGTLGLKQQRAHQTVI
jgi:hypothetical protein